MLRYLHGCKSSWDIKSSGLLKISSDVPLYILLLGQFVEAYNIFLTAQNIVLFVAIRWDIFSHVFISAIFYILL
jgi:hypothetical protein